MMNYNHPFHLVTLSPWPLMTSLSLMNLLMSILNWFMWNNFMFLLFNLINLLVIMFQWWRDVIRESTYQGFHTFIVLNMMKFNMILFIISELFFFISLFWTYFHSCISPNIEIGNMWPPKNIMMFNPYDIPLLNSVILISSGFVITWSHNLLLNNKLFYSKISLLITIILGIYFSMMQYLEYNEAKFCINDSIYGSIFYLLTGFHGMHVIIGIMFLLTCLFRMLMNHFSKIHHFHFESASWYWHFVDIIWLFVYMFIYWWMY
uniref:Cytochrome c oxidase subunit 3 n=1 Tax=Colletes gigas TaxID=935657 RepID=A0A0U1YGW9_9HYME|nr:cytochrome c oxidase subunit III [Colletes gigas]QLI42500.1 cytochrome c oxidase subunit III [Colletes gigas]